MNNTNALFILCLFLLLTMAILLYIAFKLLKKLSTTSGLLLLIITIILYFVGVATGRTCRYLYQSYTFEHNNDIVSIEERYNEGLEYEKQLEYLKAMECFIDTYNYKDSADRFVMCSKLRLLEKEKERKKEKYNE